MDVTDYFDPGELADRFAKVIGEAASDGSHVSVTVDAKGRVAEIRLDARLADVPLDRLAEAIAAVCGKAFDDRIDRLAAVVDQFERENGLSPEVLSFLHTSVASLRPKAESPTESLESTGRASEVEFEEVDMIDADPLGRRRET
jgi:DNA-binding protein YbaB